MTGTATRTGAAFVAGLLVGCGSMTAPAELPVHHYVAEASAVAPVRRVMVLPFVEAPGVRGDPEQARAAFSTELGKRQRFEVVPLPTAATEHDEIYRDVARGEGAADALAELSARYGIDGVLLGTITAYRPYQPQHLGLRVQLVSMHSGRTVWAADAVYDSNDARVIEDLRHYAGSFLAAEESLHGWEINLLSPRKFAAYVAHRLVSTCR